MSEIKTKERTKQREYGMKWVFLSSSVFSIFALLMIILFLLWQGLPVIAEVGFFKFLFGVNWEPAKENWGILPYIVGSLSVTGLTTLIGVSLGIFTSAFLYKFCPRKIVGTIRQLVNLLAGIPSVIFGLFGMLLIVPVLAQISTLAIGEGILAASIVLSIMILPTVVSISLNALYAVPDTIYEGALALGASKQQAVFKAVLPAAKSGILASVVLSIGRAIGEATAVMMVIGGRELMPSGLFGPTGTLTSVIASNAMETEYLDKLIAVGTVLLFFTLIINVTFSLVKNRGGKKSASSKEKKPPSKFLGKIGAALRPVKSGISYVMAIIGFSKVSNKIKVIFSYICAALAIIALGGIIAFILVRGVPHLSLKFVFGGYKSGEPTLRYTLIGTFYLILISIAIAVPIGIATAIFLSEYASRSKFVRYIRVAVETLAAIPSIVYGLFGYVLFVVVFGWGLSIMAGGIALAIMILPTIIRTTEESLLAIPESFREGSFALGASKVRTTFKVVLPSAAGGIISSIILAIGRVVGESAVLLLTIGWINDQTGGVMKGGSSLALDVLNLAQEHPDKAAATGVVLLILVLGLNLLATLLGKILAKGKGQK